MSRNQPARGKRNAPRAQPLIPWRMSRKKPAPDSIRGGNRFSDEDMRRRSKGSRRSRMARARVRGDKLRLRKRAPHDFAQNWDVIDSDRPLVPGGVGREEG